MLNETGYICLGKQYGNACIQFGWNSIDGSYADIVTPLAHSSIISIFAIDYINKSDTSSITELSAFTISTPLKRQNKIRAYVNSSMNIGNFGWLAITLP